MLRILSFDQAPPLSVPLRFFLSAPLFSFAAALLLMGQGADALTTRWSPLTLCLTHLITLGFLSMSMLGALIQILPVVAGISIPRPRLSATVVHTMLTLGTALLASAFWLAQSVLFKLAILALVLAFGWLLLASAIGLWQAPATAATATVVTIRLAVLALLATIILGVVLASAFAWPIRLPLMLLTNLHLQWGLLGWVGLLVMGVAYQVVPMFLVTPVYPAQILRWLAGVIFSLLVFQSLSESLMQTPPYGLTTGITALIASGLAIFGSTTLYLLWRRKRPKADATTLFWRTAMASLIACAIVWIISPEPISSGNSLTLGILFIIGFAYSATNGMLYKIVPFLIWYHLQSSESGPLKQVPSVKKILPDDTAIRQFWCHLGALILLSAATQWPIQLTRIAALAMCISSGWLGLNLFQAVRVYWRVKRTIDGRLAYPL